MQGVYVIQCGDRPLVKIGYSTNVEQRLGQLQTGHAERLRMIAVWDEGTQEDEARLHHLLRLWRKGGEWFDWHPTVDRILRDFQSARAAETARGSVALQTFALGEGKHQKWLTKIIYKSREGANAQELGRVLEYGRLGQDLEDLVMGEWSSEVLQETHYDVLRGKDFQDFLDLSGYRPSNPFKPELLLLYQEGIDLVLLKSTQTAGMEIRKWSVTEVFPDLRRQGSYALPQKEFMIEAHKAIPVPLLQEEPIRLLLSKHFSQILADHGATEDAEYGQGWNELHQTYYGMKAHQIRAMALRLGIPKAHKTSARKLAYLIDALRAANLRQSAAIDYRRIGIDGGQADALLTSAAAIEFFEGFKKLGKDMSTLPI